jgi:hypothetical protein
MANNASPGPVTPRTAVWHHERDRARSWYGGGAAEPPWLLGCRAHEPAVVVASSEFILIVTLAVLAKDDLSFLGECGHDPRELADVTKLLGFIDATSILACDLVVADAAIPAHELARRHTELVVVSAFA